MDKRKLNRSKISGKVPPGDANTEVLLMIEVSEPGYVPNWLNIRQRITHTIFTAAVMRADFAKLEADNMVVSYSINEELDQL